MDRRRTLIVDAFTTEPLGGNPAGLLPDAAGLDAEQMRAVADELGASETAFVTESDVADRRLRYFTPTGEIDLCGHATVAAHAHLFSTGVIEAGSHDVETDAGVLGVSVDDDGVVWMEMDEPTVQGVDPETERVASALGVDPASIVTGELPFAVASAGVAYLVVPVDYLATLGEVTPDRDAIQSLAEAFDATGVYAFTLDTLGRESTLHGRMFAPGEGIPEDPVTGTASAAAGAYLRFAEAFENMPEEMTFEQGHYVDRAGHVRVRVGESVRVGGQAVTSLEGELVIPEPDDDEIIEA
jgi:PhzF family phenazine biosynthesis protein